MHCRKSRAARRHEFPQFPVCRALLVVVVEVFSRLEGCDRDDRVPLAPFLGRVDDSARFVGDDVRLSILFVVRTT